MNVLHTHKPRMRAMGGTLLFFFLATISPGLGVVPLAMAAVQQDLEQAQDLYDFAEFQQAMDLVTALINGGQLTETEQRDAYIIRARCAVGMGLTTQAQDDFCVVNQLDQTWKPDPVIFPKDEVDTFNASLAGCQLAEAEVKEDSGSDEPKPWYMKPVAWAGAAGAVVLAAVLMGGGGDDDPDPVPDALDDFPDPPTKR